MFKFICLFAGFSTLVALTVRSAPAGSDSGIARRFNTSVTRDDLPKFQIDYEVYPQSAENICFSWYCNGGPRAVAPNRPAADQNRASNSCGKGTNRCSKLNGHSEGYQCDEWPWASSTGGGANVATRCIPGPDNGGSGKSWGNFINNQGPNPPGHVLQDNEDYVEIQIVNIPYPEENKGVTFCLGERGEHITPGACAVLDHGQPYLQQIG